MAHTLSLRCSPNTFTFWEPSQLILRIRAIKPIRANSEITVTYVHSLCAPQAAGQQQTLKMYSFKCACSACSVPASASNTRRKRLGLGQVDLVRWMRWRRDPPTTRTGLEKTVRECEELLDLARQEGMEDLCMTWAVHVDMRARALAALGDHGRFPEAARQAQWAWEVRAQDGEMDVGDLVSVWEDIVQEYESGKAVPGWAARRTDSQMMERGQLKS
jgi:hypothetical protein